MAWPLPPATRRLVGWLFLIAGTLLLLGVALRVFVLYDAYQRLGMAALTIQQMLLHLTMLIAALLMLRYGWHERRADVP